MAGWTDDELRRIGRAEELEIAAVRRDGTRRVPRPIWVVRAGDGLYARAAYGAASGLHRSTRARGQARISAGGVNTDVTAQDADAGVLDTVDAAYREKYGRRYTSIVDSIYRSPRNHAPADAPDMTPLQHPRPRVGGPGPYSVEQPGVRSRRRS